jgi:hypothetical protein
VAVGATVPVQVNLKAFACYTGSVSYDQLLTTLQDKIIRLLHILKLTKTVLVVRPFGTWAHWSSLFKPLKKLNFKALKNYKKICEHSQLYTLRSWKFII